MFLILFGAPGVGKGTQAEVLARRTGLPHLSTGEEFRRNIQGMTELGVRVRQIVDSGQLVPDDLVVEIVVSALERDTYADGCIFDGFPRTLAQARKLDEILSMKHQSISMVINIEVPESDIIERLMKRGRQDDTEEVIRHRLQVYEEQTSPLVRYYRDQGKLHSIDGNADVDTVNGSIMELLSR
ncbi:MAG: adenylate kinase [Candidatus Kapaibacterium sp.]